MPNAATIGSVSNACLICNTSMDALNTHVLKCNHKFHYDCILGWYKTCASKFLTHSNNFKVQTCPYCRNKGGWLPIKEGDTPIEYVNCDHIKHGAAVKKLSKKTKAKLFSGPPPGGPVGVQGPIGIAGPGSTGPGGKIICAATLKHKVGATVVHHCKCTASFPDSTGAIKFCGKHKFFKPTIQCLAMCGTGFQCKNAAKYANIAGELKCCGVHKNKVNNDAWLVGSPYPLPAN